MTLKDHLKYCKKEERRKRIEGAKTKEEILPLIKSDINNINRKVKNIRTLGITVTNYINEVVSNMIIIRYLKNGTKEYIDMIRKDKEGNFKLYYNEKYLETLPTTTLQNILKILEGFIKNNINSNDGFFGRLSLNDNRRMHKFLSDLSLSATYKDCDIILKNKNVIFDHYFNRMELLNGGEIYSYIPTFTIEINHEIFFETLKTFVTHKNLNLSDCFQNSLNEKIRWLNLYKIGYKIKG